MIRKNVVSNMMARAWGVLSVYLFVPLYLEFLGIEAYGLVGFYSTLLGVLAFADMGFTATLNREMARLSVRRDSSKEMQDLLRTYEATYVCISSAIALAIHVLAPAIAERWLHSKGLQTNEITLAIRLMGVSIALQLPSGLYIGGLMGLEKQVRANSIQIAWGVFRGGGAVLVLWLVAPTIFAFALWQLLSNTIYCFTARHVLWRAVLSSATQARPHFRWEVFRRTWRYAGGMVGMSVVSTLLTQADKIAISKMLSLEMLGYYTLAGTLASVPLMLTSPIAMAVFPRLTGLVALGDRKSLTELYHRTCAMVALAAIPAGLTAGLFAGDFLVAWTGSAITGQRAGLAASLLLGGQLVQALGVVPFYLALAHGKVKLNLQIGVISVVMVTPLLLWLVTRYGIAGAGMSWLVLNLCTLPPYMYFLHRRFLPGELRTWLLRDMGCPLLAALPGVLLCRCLLPPPSSRFVALCIVGVAWIASAVPVALANSELRSLWNRKSKPVPYSAS